MAKSPSHGFGQIIGNVLEKAVEPFLQQFVEQHNLYLDKKGKRTARKGNKVSWTDSNGNKHDLDFVLEKDGSYTKRGAPTAFIEVAWRRYTKHSRNKVQEIQGAILPLVATYQTNTPFIGVILAGVYTEGALTQLKSLGFRVLYFPYDTIIKAFNSVNINAFYDETTADSEFIERVNKWKSLSTEQHNLVTIELTKIYLKEILKFMQSLQIFITRRIISIRIFPLHGNLFECDSIEKAIGFIENYDESGNHRISFIKYTIEVLYNNGDNLKGEFTNKETATQFIHNYQII